MAIEALKENLCISQIIGKVNENVVVDEDIIIPDIKPDILSTINISGNICVYKKEVLDGKVRIDGGVQLYIMYLADDESSSVRGLNTVIDFSKTIDMENVNGTMGMEVDLKLAGTECKILNGRKINVKAVIESKITVYSNENVEFIKEIDCSKGIQVLNNTETVNSLLGCGNTKVFAKDTVELNDSENLAEVMKLDVNIINKEIKSSYNKILIKADSCVAMVYLTEEGEVKETRKVIPIMGFVDMQNVSDDNICNLSFEIKNILIKPNSDEHSIYIEIEFGIDCFVYEKKEINIIQDLYSPIENLALEQKRINILKEKDDVSEELTVRDNVKMPELQGNGKICNVDVVPAILSEKKRGNSIIVDGELHLKIMYMSAGNNRVDVKLQTIPFNVDISSSKITDQISTNSSVDVLKQDYTVMPDDSIDINVELQLNVDISRTEEVNVIDDIQEAEDNDVNVYSIVIYFVKPGDTLWKIAKKFKSTIKAISTVNGIEDENQISIGQQLFIPKFV